MSSSALPPASDYHAVKNSSISGATAVTIASSCSKHNNSKETIKDRFKECNRARENRNIRTETHRHRRRKCYRHALYLPMMSMTNRTKPKIHKNQRRYGIVREVGLPQSKNAAPWWSFATRAQSIISFSDTWEITPLITKAFQHKLALACNGDIAYHSAVVVAPCWSTFGASSSMASLR